MSTPRAEEPEQDSGPSPDEPQPAPAEVEGEEAAPAEVEGEEAALDGDVVERDFDELTEAQRERDEYLELAKRTKADFENYRKRVARDQAEALARGKGQLARQLIPALDNLERALLVSGIDPSSDGAGEDDPPSGEVSAKDALAEGVALVYRELRSTLERAGVQAYDPTGEKFDPALHEALSTRAEEGVEPGEVVETLEKGYRLDSQVLRPARVVVGE
ncbi:MAG: nucleotide exchange factor GrpE [Solirubrobacterales bacterium]|nr:nucleotide exchange factor GrpE [Solirubrobacterales bacterium]